MGRFVTGGIGKSQPFWIGNVEIDVFAIERVRLSVRQATISAGWQIWLSN